MSTRRPLLTQEEFEALKPHLSKRADLNALYSVMVNGESQKKVAQDSTPRCSPEAVSKAVNKAYTKFHDVVKRPAGWVAVNILVPEHLASSIVSMSHQAQTHAFAQLRENDADEN